MKQYILIKSDEDGNPVSWLDPRELEDIGQLMEDYGVRTFLDRVPMNNDQNYWNKGEALLMEVRILKVRPVEVVKQWVAE